jgi:Ala-tRNA(Pro) deacylase
MAGTELTSKLDAENAEYELLPHAHTERALDEAKALGVRPDEVAKTVVVTTPTGNVRAVLPASERVDLRKVAELYGESKKNVHLASEEVLARDYREFELGAVPPIGGASPDDVIIDRRVALEDMIVLEAGNHDESLRMRTEDLIRIADARLADICEDGDEAT